MTVHSESTMAGPGIGAHPSVAQIGPGGPVLVVPGLPQGVGPQIAAVSLADETTNAGSVVVDATIVVPDVTVFRLSTGLPQEANSGGVRIIPVAPLVEIGSPELGTALVQGSLPGVLQALAYDVVLLPVSVSGQGVIDTRVFAAGAGLPTLCLFSSALVLERFLAEDGLRLFVVMHGAAVVDYLAGHLDQIGTVVFDAGSPSSLTISAADLAGFLNEGDTADAPPDRGLSEPGEDAPQVISGVVGFDLGLGSQWGVIELGDEDRCRHQIDLLVDRQTTTLGDNQVLVRRDLRTWLGEVVAQAAQGGGSQVGFLLARTKTAAAALSVVTYCHSLGVETSGQSHVERIAAHLVGKADPDDQLVRVDTPQGPIIRHARIRQGGRRVGGGQVPVLSIDYWVTGPDGDHVGHVSFSTPHVDARVAILDLADNVVFNGRWILADRVAGG